MILVVPCRKWMPSLESLLAQMPHVAHNVCVCTCPLEPWFALTLDKCFNLSSQGKATDTQ